MHEGFNPQMLSLARDYANVTQKELAEQLSTSQARISKIEEGLQPVSDDFLKSVCSFFARPEDFFLQWPGHNMTLEGHFRKKSSLTKNVLKMADARMNIERLQINKLLKTCDYAIPDVPSCNPDEFRNGPKEIAQLLRKHLGVISGPVDNLVEVIESAGCIVRFIDFGTLKIDGFAVISGVNTPIIFANKFYPADRRRLTLAHEFGHIVMHRGMVRPNMEDEAYEFASEFLMPEKEIKPSLFPLTIDKLARLKLRWKVSMAAILQHSKRIGTINERYYRFLRSELSKHGYTKQEPYEINVPVERPKLLTKIFWFYKSELNYTKEEMAKLLFATENEVHSLASPNHERLSILE